MTNLAGKARQARTAVTAVAALLKFTTNTDTGKVDRVTFVGIPLWNRDASGQRRLFGIRLRK